MSSVRLLSALLVALSLAGSALTHPRLATAATRLTFAVTTMADTPDAAPGDGICATSTNQCTLRAAVQEANAQAAGGAITITLPAGVYPLPLGTLVLTHNRITLAGAGARTTTIAGQGTRVLAVAVTAVVTISGVTVTEGNAGSSVGGGVANQGVTILSRSAVVSDTAAGGGGLYNGPGAWLLLLNSAVVSSTAPRGQGAASTTRGRWP